MNERTKQILIGVVALAELIAILDLRGTVDVLPPKVAAAVAGIITAAAAVAHIGKGLLGDTKKADEPK